MANILQFTLEFPIRTPFPWDVQLPSWITSFTNPSNNGYFYREPPMINLLTLNQPKWGAPPMIGWWKFYMERWGMVWPSNSILWIPPTAMEHPPGKVPKKKSPLPHWISHGHIGLPQGRDMWQCVKTWKTPVVHIKIAGIYGCSSP